MSADLVMGNVPDYGKTFRSKAEMSSARGLGGHLKLLNSVFISQDYETAISIQTPCSGWNIFLNIWRLLLCRGSSYKKMIDASFER